MHLSWALKPDLDSNSWGSWASQFIFLSLNIFVGLMGISTPKSQYYCERHNILCWACGQTHILRIIFSKLYNNMSNVLLCSCIFGVLSPSPRAWSPKNQLYLLLQFFWCAYEWNSIDCKTVSHEEQALLESLQPVECWVASRSNCSYQPTWPGFQDLLLIPNNLSHFFKCQININQWVTWIKSFQN